MDSQELATRVVDRMFNNDPFSQWLGITRVKDAPGQSVLQLTVRKEMLNGFDILHGGITYSLADSALAFAANSHGRMCVSIETSISHVGACKEGDVLTAIAEEVNRSNTLAIYHVTITNQHGDRVALFKGTVFRKQREWFPENENSEKP